ncbi:radical SAM protein [Streptacidiphilus sp. P02-A3a]|uniref:radical SAM protein n=1 Tax=Streptacidiphilus sp. P02-A3a TaxID=2704468 RepID=UPI0015FAD25E|nr:radical SAM protein [Streptacidiphilus sp. P02-A3a]QMU73260.1 radical SAM protein [Streptacidiphilus sp. P02-A3a]
MHLAELLGRRSLPASAVFLAVTRRCPLHCGHCSTTSGTDGEEQPAALLRRFVETFTPADHPEFLLLTGGEPLLRPGLVRTLAGTARAAGTRSYLLSGMFFARTGATPDPIRAALRSVDHVAASLDAFHEREVPREQVFRVLREVLDSGRDASVQACGKGPDDPYLAELTEQVRAEFGDRVPMFVSTLRPVGRARAWLTALDATRAPGGDPARGTSDARARGPRAAPCDLAAWPTVGFDGTVTACCNQDLLDQAPPPAHLTLGHIASTTWPEVRRRSQSRPVLRALRTRGPLQLAYRHGGSDQPDADYCGSCRALGDRPGTLAAVAAGAAGPTAELLEQQAVGLQLAAGAVGFARRHGDPTRAGLVLLGSGGGIAGQAAGQAEGVPR